MFSTQLARATREKIVLAAHIQSVTRCYMQHLTELCWYESVQSGCSVQQSSGYLFKQAELAHSCSCCSTTILAVHTWGCAAACLLLLHSWLVYYTNLWLHCCFFLLKCAAVAWCAGRWASQQSSAQCCWQWGGECLTVRVVHQELACSYLPPSCRSWRKFSDCIWYAVGVGATPAPTVAGGNTAGPETNLLLSGTSAAPH
jgi:hypothetical protein